jgi:hypothetical protein
MRTLILAAVALSFGIHGAKAQSYTYVTPNGFGGYTINTPGATNPYTYVTPNGFGGYTENTPGAANPYTYVSPNGFGGYTVNTPGQ